MFVRYNIIYRSFCYVMFLGALLLFQGRTYSFKAVNIDKKIAEYDRDARERRITHLDEETSMSVYGIDFNFDGYDNLFSLPSKNVLISMACVTAVCCLRVGEIWYASHGVIEHE